MKNELYHYGVKGMKWGIRRYQNYDGSYKNGGYRHDQKTRKASSGKSAKLKGSVAAIFAPYITLLALTAAISGGRRLKEYKDYKKNIKEYVKTHKYDKESGYFLINGKHDNPKTEAKKVNPGYKDGKYGTSSNCAMCTTAYELRRRGYDVCANLSQTGLGVTKYSSFFVGAEPKSDVDMSKKLLEDLKRRKKDYTVEDLQRINEIRADRMISEIEKQPPGSRGNLGLTFYYGGHSVAYEIGKDGKMFIVDAQSGTVYTRGETEDILTRTIPGGIQYFRTDNLAINKPNMTEAVTNHAVSYYRSTLNVNLSSIRRNSGEESKYEYRLTKDRRAKAEKAVERILVENPDMVVEDSSPMTQMLEEMKGAA